ncbi:MAG: alpha/beta hydrolase [Bacteroidota bacterium]
MTEGFAHNGDVKIHFIDTGFKSAEMPLVMIPGMVNCAEELAEKAANLFKRRVIFLSIRGRGNSDSPESGYTFKDQVSDIAAVVDFLKLDGFYLYGHSVGAAFAISYTHQFPLKVRGLILGDYPPWYPKFSEQWRDRVLAMTQHTMTKIAVEGVVRDAEMQVFIDELQEIQCPVLVIKGAQEDSLLPEDAVEVFTKNLTHCEVEVLKDCGHDLFEPTAESFKNAVMKFIMSCY